MGKCASKQPAPGLNEFGSSPYLAICSEDDILYINVGQSESKKASKKAAAAAAAAAADGPHTKGTAMSFGFKRHKVHQAGGTNHATATGATGHGKLPPSGAKAGEAGTATETTAVPGAVANQIKKFNANGNLLPGAALEREKAERELVQATVISNPGVDVSELSDKNGNTGSIDSVDDTGGGGGGRHSSNGRSTPRLQPAKKDSHGAPYRSNRFGFRTNNIVRPASVGLQPRVANGDFDKHSANNNNNNNNNIHANNNNNSNVYVVTDKRRSKSASSAASARTTFTPLPATTTTTTTAAAAAAAAAPSAASAGTGPAMALHQHAYGGGASALHRPLPKYQAPFTKINQQINAPDSNGSGGAGTYQQPVTKCNLGEQHKNTQHSASTQRQTGLQHQYTPASEAGQNAPAAGGQHAKPPAQAASAATVAKLGQEAVASKFTLHTSSLPKPQYPVSISLAGSTGGPVPSSRYTMDTKGAKHAVNVSRKEFASTSAAGAPALEDTTTTTTSSIRMPRQRYRNLEMVMSGRHKFEVRDLEALTTEPIEPLPLPDLPSAFGSTVNQRTAPLSGLIRSTDLAASASATTFDDDIDINDNRYEPTGPDAEEGDEQENTAATYDIGDTKGCGLIDSASTRCPSDGESFEEEKLLRDNNSSEKSLKGALIKELTEQSVESKSSSPGSSRASWCNAGEALASKDFGSLSLSSSEDSRAGKTSAARQPPPQTHAEMDEEDVSSVTITAGNPSAFSSMSAPVPMDVSTNLDSVSEVQISFTDPGTDPLASSENDVPNRMYGNEQSKFAEMAAAISDVLLLDDETSPTDSLVSSCTENSDDAKKPRHSKKAAENTKEKEKDVDEISPELEELTSPVSPGTPTHASNSLSLSDGGRDFLIDDEIADQPGLVFDEGSTLDLGSLNLNLGSQNTDTPTLKDSHNRPIASQPAAAKTAPPVPKPRKVLPPAYESPALSRKSTRSGNRMVRAESLDTLSPCDSIASDDFMLDFDCNSSMDSIDRVARVSVGGSATGLHSMDELQLWSELENKGGHIIREWSSLLRSNPNSMTNSFNNNHNTSRESITSQLPARARLLTRRLQNNATPTNGSESPRSIDSLPRRTFAGAYKTATLSQFHNLANNNNSSSSSHAAVCTDSASTATNSAEDLTLLDKSLRNSMLQDVVHFKKQLVRLRRILQEDEENLMMTDTLNPFENNNGQFFTTAAAVNNNGSGSIGPGVVPDGPPPGGLDSNRQQEQGAGGVLVRESGVAALALLEDQRQELADLRRQVVYLQGELTTKDRTIRQQQNLIEKYEAEREKQHRDGSSNGTTEATGASATFEPPAGDKSHSETVSQATQTERLRPVSFGGQEGLGSRNEQPTPPKNGLRTPTAAASSSSSSPSHAISNGPASSGSRSTPSKTQISSVYTQLSSVRHSIAGSSAPTTPTNHGGPTALRRTSLGSSHNLSSFGLHGSPSPTSTGASKSVRTTHIGTLAATGRQPTNGDRIPVLVNGAAAKHGKIGTTNHRTTPSAQPNGHSHPSKPNGLNGATKRPAATVIRPPSSFGASIIAPVDAQQALLKSKSAPATPLVASGKLLTAPATGNATDTTLTTSINGGHANGQAAPSGSSSSSSKETSADECESDRDTVVNGAILGSLKLLPNGPAGCSDTSQIGNSTPNGIVGH